MNHGVPSKQASPRGDHLAVGRRPVARPEPRSSVGRRSAHARKDPAPPALKAPGVAVACPNSSKTSAVGHPASRAVCGARKPRRHPAPPGPLTMAFEAVDTFPALAEARTRLLSVIAKEHHATADVVSAIESDVALTMAGATPRQPGTAGARPCRHRRSRGRAASSPGNPDHCQPCAGVRLLRASRHLGRRTGAFQTARASHPACR